MTYHLLIFIFILAAISFTPLVDGALTNSTTHTVERDSQPDSVYSFDFSPDGKNAYFIHGPSTGGTDLLLAHYNVPNPFNVTSINLQDNLYSTTIPLVQDHLFSYTLHVTDDGKFLYLFVFSNNIRNSGDELIYKFQLRESFLLSTINLASVETIDYNSTGDRHILHIDFSPDGTSLYTGSFYTHLISEYRLSTPFDISFDNLVTRLNIGTTLLPIQMSHDGNYIFTNNFPHGLRGYSLSVPFQLSSVQNGTEIIPDIGLDSSGIFVSDFEWFNDGLSLLIKRNNDVELYEYTFNMPYSINDIPRRESTLSTPLQPPSVVTNNPANERSFVSSINEERQGSGGCSGDCTYPTIGLDKYNNRLVDGGFSYNNNITNVIPWHTPYPLISVETHEFNEMVIKAWDNNTIRLIQISLGIPEIGSPTMDAEILVEAWFEPYTSNIEELKVIDPHNLLKHPLISAKSEMVDCRAGNDEQCVELTINYVYDNIPKYNIVKVDVMDFARNVQSTTFNDGIEIFGTVTNEKLEKMIVTNIPAHHPSKYHVEVSKVSTINDLWMDKYGYHWIGDESKIHLVKDILFVRHQDKQSNFGSQDRNNSNFEKMIQYEKQRAQKILEEFYGHQIGD